MAYVTQQEFNIALQDIEKIKDEITCLKENKADKEVLQNIKQDIAVLKKSIEDMHSDRTEDKETIKKLTEEVKRLNETVTNYSIANEKIKVNQENTLEKINDFKEDMKNMQEQMQQMSQSINTLNNTFQNLPSNIFAKMYNQYPLFKAAVRFLIVIFIIIMFTSCSFYVKNGVPWSQLKSIFTAVR